MANVVRDAMSGAGGDPLQAAILAALALHQSGQRSEAEQRYRELLTTAPEHPVLWHLLGALLHEQGRSNDAAIHIERAIQFHDRDPLFFSNLGEVYRVLRRLGDAQRVLERSLEMNPQHAETYYKLGLVFSDQQRSREAIACFQQALRLQPSHTLALNNWGCELTKLDRPGEAIPLFVEALRLNDQLALAHNNLGAALSLIERAGEAIGHYRRALELDPAFREAFSNLLFAVSYDATIDCDSLFSLHTEFGRRFATGLPAPPPWLQTPEPERRLRIGYVSGDLRRHPVAYFVWPILQAHDRSRLELICYHDHPKPDDVTAALQSLCEDWVSTVGWTDDELLQRIRADKIDVLVDLSGHTTRNRLMVFAHRAAPVQVTYLGYVSTTGIPAMDYRITDAHCDPPEEPARHVEQLVRLPRLFCAYMPIPDAPPVAPLPALERGYVTFGSLHNLSKLGPATIALWSQVLHAVPESRLRIVRRTLTAEIQERLRRGFMEQGVDPQRLEFADNWEAGQNHLTCYDDIDITLDVVPWSGHTTACESLWMGVPIVTLHGDRHAGRMVSSVLHAIGRREWIANSPAEYVAAAARLVGDVPRLAGIREGLREHIAASTLCDGVSLTRHVEESFRTMWRTWCGRIRR